MSNKPFKMKVWIWVSLVTAILLLFFNFDPVGNMLNNAFGKEADKWAINIVVVAFIIYIVFDEINKK